MKKSVLLTSLAFSLILITLVIAYTVIPSPGHGGDEVYINAGGETTLQAAIDTNLFDNCALAGGTYSSQILKGHPGDEILVNIDGNVKTLQAAINDGSLVNSPVGGDPADYSSYSGSLVQYQTANKIQVITTVEKNLQTAINAGDFECTPACSPETNAQFCSRLGKNCNSVTSLDNCGVSRTVNCGSCGSSSACVNNVCTSYSGMSQAQCNSYGGTWHPSVCLSRPSCTTCAGVDYCRSIGCSWNSCGMRCSYCGGMNYQCEGTANCQSWSTAYCS